MLNEAALQTCIGNRPFRFFSQVDSTQDLAFAWLREGAESGAAVIGDEQVKGRGRQGRVWHTPPGVALALSVILKPRTEVLPQITMLGAVAIAEVIESLIPDERQRVTVKWPNDVKIDGRKVCGILPEAVWNGNRLLGVALGMGVNVRANFAGTELESTAVSLEPTLGLSLNRGELICRLLARLDHWAQWLGSDALFRAWETRLETLGRSVEINGVRGVAERVDADGRLYVRDVDGKIHAMLAGDISNSE